MYLVEDRLTTGLKTGKAGDVKAWISNARKKLREGFMKHWQKIVAGAVVVIGAAIAAIVLNEKRKDDDTGYSSSTNDDELHVKVAKKMRGAYTAMKEFFKSLFTKTGRELAKARRKNFKDNKRDINRGYKNKTKDALTLAKKGNKADDWSKYGETVKALGRERGESMMSARYKSRNLGRDEEVSGSTSWERIWSTILGAWIKIKKKLMEYEFFKSLFDTKEDNDMESFIKQVEAHSKKDGNRLNSGWGKGERNALQSAASGHAAGFRAAAKKSFAQFDYLMEEAIAQTVHFNEEVERGLYEGRSLMESAFEVDTSVYEEADLVAEAVAIVFEDVDKEALNDIDVEDNLEGEVNEAYAFLYEEEDEFEDLEESVNSLFL